MDTISVAYVLCRIGDDSSLTPISEHEDMLTRIAAGGYAVEVEDLEFAYALYAGHPSNGSSTRVASFREGRIGYREWATRSGRISPQRRGSLRPRHRRALGVIVVATKRAGSSYEERTCMRCFEGRVYDVERGAWVACERCSGSGRVMVYLYPKLNRYSR